MVLLRNSEISETLSHKGSKRRRPSSHGAEIKVVKFMIPCESVGIVTTAGSEVTTLDRILGANFRKFENMCECINLGNAMIESMGQ